MRQKIKWEYRQIPPKILRLRYILLIIGIVIVVWQIFRFINLGKYFKKGNEFYSQGKIDEAIETWERASRLNPFSAKIFNNLAIAYNRKKLYTKSYEASKRAIELKPDYESAFLIFGESCFHLARNEEKKENHWEARKFYRKCVDACKKALKFAPAADTIHYLGTAYLCLGEYDEGIQFFTSMAKNRDTQEEMDLLMNAKKNFLTGTGPNQIIGANTEGLLPPGAEIAVVGHPIFTFSPEERKNFQNGIFYSDLDKDKQTELVLVYKISGEENKNSFFVSIFDWDVDRWKFRWNTKVSDYSVGYFTVEDINGDTKPEILIEGIYDAQSGALINIYVWDGSFYKTIQQFGPTWGTTLYDVDGDGAKEIIILDKKREEYNSFLYKWDGIKYVKVDE